MSAKDVADIVLLQLRLPQSVLVKHSLVFPTDERNWGFRRSGILAKRIDADSHYVSFLSRQDAEFQAEREFSLGREDDEVALGLLGL
jgi:hypothetical protein